MKRVKLNPDVVDEVFWGVGDTPVCKDVYTPVAARQTLLKAGLPPETPSISLDKACISGMLAVKLGVTAIRSGEIEGPLEGNHYLQPGTLNCKRTSVRRVSHWGCENGRSAL